MRQYRLASTITLLLLLLSQNSWSFSPRPSFRLLSAALQSVATPTNDDVLVATDTNVLTFSPLHKTPLAAWQSLIPLIPGERGCDVSIEWSLPQEGSRRLLQHLFPSSPVDILDQLQPLLQESFQTFSSLATPHGQKFKARIVATRGPSGQKCPRWHVDHVPLRWIQSLVGPGCDYVLGAQGIHWDAMNDLDDIESNTANSKLVNETIACVCHAPPLQGVVLFGAEHDEALVLAPAVHKSPSMGLFQGRVLLTLDVLRDK